MVVIICKLRDTTCEQGVRMPLQAMTAVRAIHDIQYGRTIVVHHGAPGRVVNLQPGWADTRYTVEFTPENGSTLTLVGLTAGDVAPS